MSAVCSFAILPGFALLFLFLLIYYWFIYYLAKPNPERIFEIFLSDPNLSGDGSEKALVG